MSDSLRPHESQHARPPCPSPTPEIHPGSHPSSQMPSSHLILCRPLLLLPPIPPSISVFSNELTLHMRWLKYWSFSFSIIPSKEIPGLSASNVSEASETVLNSFHSFVFILLLGSYFHHSIFQLTYLVFCLGYSAIIDSF